MYRSNRFDNTAGISKDNTSWPDLSIPDNEKYESPQDIVNSAANKFCNLTEYQVDNVSDIAFIGDANLDTEFCGWGLNHVSPYVD